MSLVGILAMGCIGLGSVVVEQARRLRRYETLVERHTENSGFFTRPKG